MYTQTHTHTHMFFFKMYSLHINKERKKNNNVYFFKRAKHKHLVPVGELINRFINQQPGLMTLSTTCARS